MYEICTHLLFSAIILTIIVYGIVLGYLSATPSKWVDAIMGIFWVSVSVVFVSHIHFIYVLWYWFIFGCMYDVTMLVTIVFCFSLYKCVI